MGRFGAVLAMTLCVLVAGTSGATAAPGDLDRSFGVDGVVQAFAHLPGSAGETTVGMAIGPDDEILVLGRATRLCNFVPCGTALVVRRYVAGGVFDPLFGVNGSVVVPASPSGPFDEAGAIEVGSDGRFVVAAPDGDDVAVHRFRPDGAPDAGFGGDGVVVADFGGREAVADVAFGPDGEVILAAVREAQPEGALPLLVRYLPDGRIDESFGDRGSVLFNFAPAYRPHGLVVLGRGRIAVGLSDCCYGGRAIVARLLADGSLDRSFARRGWRSVGRLSPASLGTVLAAGRGRLLAVGAFRNRIFVARLRRAGGFDRSFGRRGFVWPGSSIGGRWDDAALDRAGRLAIVTGGAVSRGGGLHRLRPNGRVDRSFAGGAGARTGSMGLALGLGLESSGRIVLLGEDASECIRTCPQPRTLIARYIGGTSTSRCLGRRANVVGTRNGEKIVGTRGPDVIQALGGADRVHGRGGNDLICGGAGDDRLVGGRGRDRLAGGAGRNERLP